MKKKIVVIVFFIIALTVLFSFKNTIPGNYKTDYDIKLLIFKSRQLALVACIEKNDLSSIKDIEKIKTQLNEARLALKSIDFWLRYLEPISYKKINGPLPVEWETEVFEKFEKPYKREGAGLTLAALYLEEKKLNKDVLLDLIRSSINATQVYTSDSIATQLKDYNHFFLCNRLFLLNLAAIYTTGFECPASEKIVPELNAMLKEVGKTYSVFNTSFTETPLTENYLELYKATVQFVNKQPLDFEKFDHFTFIKDFINPLFTINQQLIKEYNVSSKSNIDYSLNKNSTSIFSKNLYNGQNSKGIYLRIKDQKILAEIEKIGKLLFYDPILSGNNLRSCASCHKPTQYFTDTLTNTSLQFDGKNYLPRNSPSLINAQYNHLILLDGKHITLQHQTKDVITNPIELGSNEQEVLKKILSCEEYKTAFKQFLKYTPTEKEITIEHVSSAITLYYAKFSKYYSSFDMAMNNNEAMNEPAKKGFNVFMSKAQCATCHFVPQFNGVKPPYVGSEFEVLGVPKDINFNYLSPDSGRFRINPATEMANAFRTGTIRNAAKTMPYMHNGVFRNLDQVIDFYDAGGGIGKGLKINNQTLSSDSLHLSKEDKINLLAFIRSLDEKIEFENVPEKLPTSKIKKLNNRKVSGEY
ncbi:MAG: cytochrome C peroxidase [Bacteroidetes bacterium]|nr:cytochrome C peroxidase [Bacteroidota bacterium]